MMDTGVVRRVKSKGRVLVASTNTAFAATVGNMVFEAASRLHFRRNSRGRGCP
jgi:hypothetical protein